MQVLLNIGLKSTKKNIGVGSVLRALAGASFNVAEYNVQHSSTEPTVVAQATFTGAKSLLRTCAFLTALHLHQDCVALLIDGQEGHLIGPKAEEWGEFDPAQFLLLDGTRLAQPAKAAS